MRRVNREAEREQTVGVESSEEERPNGKWEEKGEKPVGYKPAGETLDILYLNAQSIVKKIDELACTAEIEKPDLILITETWCNGDITDTFFSIDGYDLQTNLRVDRKDTARGRGGGLLVYAKEGVQVLKVDNQVNIHESCTFMVNDVTINQVYRSPNAHKS
jgi:hypothetical protein